MFGWKRGLKWLDCLILFSVFGVLLFYFPEMFGGGEFREKFVKPGSGVLLLEISQWVALMLV